MKLLVSVVVAAIAQAPADGGPPTPGHDSMGAMDGLADAGHGDMGGMDGMDHGSMDGMDHGSMDGMDHGDMDMTTHNMHFTTAAPHHDMGDMDGSGDMDHDDHHDDDKHDDDKHDKPTHCSGPNCREGCADAMANWHQEMGKWKYMQNEWAREFKAWQMENGQYDMNMDHMDMPHKDEDHKDDHKDDHYDEDHFEDSSMGMMGDMQWAEDMWNMLYPFLGDPDMLCPLLGMVGPGWEEGCRKQMGHQNSMIYLIENFEWMKSDEWANPMCDAIGGVMMDQFNNFGMENEAMAVMYAKDSCRCLMSNVHSLVMGGMQPASFANIGSCVNTMTSYVNMLMSYGSMDMDMDMGHGGMDGHNGPTDAEIAMWYSEESVAAVMEVVTGFAANITVSQDLLDMIKFWDDDNMFAEWGLFDGNVEEGTVDMDGLWKAIAYSWIWITNTEPEMTVDQFVAMLNNPGAWNEFYGALRAMAMDVFAKQNNVEDATDIVDASWGMILEWGESFPKFFAENFDFKTEEESQMWLENLIQLSVNPESIDFYGASAAFTELGENFDIENFTRVVKWYYENFVMNNPMPQKPNYIFGLAKCMSVEDITAYNTPPAGLTDEQDIFMAVVGQWTEGMTSMYMTDVDFTECIAPFDKYSFDYSDMWAQMNANDTA